VWCGGFGSWRTGAAKFEGDFVDVQVWAADRSYADAVRAARAECRGIGVRPPAFRTRSIVCCLDPESAGFSCCHLGACIRVQDRKRALEAAVGLLCARTFLPGTLSEVRALSCMLFSHFAVPPLPCRHVEASKISTSVWCQSALRNFESSATLLRQRRFVVKVSLGTQ
jgi:hypothetical protein